jgi:transposase
LISDAAWSEIVPQLPPSGGKRKVDDRAALEGILYVLGHDIAWYDLPRELGYGSGMTCWRRLRDWHAMGVWDLHQHVLVRHLPRDQVDFSRIVGGEAHATARPRKPHRRVRTSFLGAAAPAPYPMAWTHHATATPTTRRRDRAPAKACPVPSSPFAQ